MNGVIQKNGVYLCERVRAIEQKTLECTLYTENASRVFFEKLAPIETAVSQFAEVERNVTVVFERRLRECEVIRDQLFASSSKLMRMDDDIKVAKSAVQKLTEAWPDREKRIFRCENFVNKYETQLAVLETDLTSHKRDIRISRRESSEARGCSVKVRSMAKEMAEGLDVLAYNVAESRMAHTGVIDNPSVRGAVSTAKVAARLLRRRGYSCPPPVEEDSEPVEEDSGETT